MLLRIAPLEQHHPLLPTHKLVSRQEPLVFVILHITPAGIGANLRQSRHRKVRVLIVMNSEEPMSFLYSALKTMEPPVTKLSASEGYQPA